MSHKLVGFSNSINSEYIQSQLLSISNEILDLETEFANENDYRLARYCKRPDRMPCFMVFKNDVHLNHIHAKMTDDYAVKWVKGAIG